MNHRYMLEGSGRRGFTLLELLAVVAVIALVAAMAVVSVRSFARSERLNGAYEWFAGLVSEGRGRAMAERRTLELAIVFDGASARTEVKDKKTGALVSGPSHLDPAFRLFRGAEIEGSLQVSLYPDGTLSVSPSDASSIKFDEDPAGFHDIAIRERVAAESAYYIDLAGPAGRVRGVRRPYGESP